MSKLKWNTEVMNNFGLLALRVGLGVIFVYHGWGKLNNIEGVIGFFGNLGLPVAVFWAYLVAFVEFLGGLAVLLGFFTRFAAKLLAIVMLVALLAVHSQGSFAEAELVISLLGGALGLLAAGGGKWQMTTKDAPWLS